MFQIFRASTQEKSFKTSATFLKQCVLAVMSSLALFSTLYKLNVALSYIEYSAVVFFGIGVWVVYWFVSRASFYSNTLHYFRYYITFCLAIFLLLSGLCDSTFFMLMVLNGFAIFWYIFPNSLAARHLHFIKPFIIAFVWTNCIYFIPTTVYSNNSLTILSFTFFIFIVILSMLYDKLDLPYDQKHGLVTLAIILPKWLWLTIISMLHVLLFSILCFCHYTSLALSMVLAFCILYIALYFCKNFLRYSLVDAMIGEWAIAICLLS